MSIGNNNNNNENVVTAVPVTIPVQATNVNVVSQNITTRMKECYALSRTVKCLALIDFTFSFIYALYNFWYFIPLLFSYSGYYGAKNFNTKYTFIYVIYLLLNTISRILFFVYVCLNQSIVSNFNYFVIVSIISVFIEFWILKVVHHFYKLLKQFSIFEIENLRQIRHLEYRVIYY